MGFMDKLKDVTKSSLDVASKIVEEQKEKQKAAKAALLTNVVKHGSIKGGKIPKSEKTVYFQIDVENNRLIIFEYLGSKMFTDEEMGKMIMEYSLDEIVEFKHKEKQVHDYDTVVMTNFYNEFILTSGEQLEIYHSYDKRDSGDTEFCLNREIDTILGLNSVIFIFILQVKDDKTKQWINEFYSEYSTNPVFDVNGELDYENLKEARHLMLEAKEREWARRRVNLS